MRSTFLSIFWLAGCLPCGVAAAQPGDVPPRLSLTDAVRFAEERNASLETARRRAAAAEADRLAARRRPNPVVSLRSEGYHAAPPDAGLVDQQELSFQVEQEVETAGKLRLRSRSAEAAAGAARAALDDRYRQVRYEVQRAYFLLVLARLDADLARESLDEIDRVIALNRSRYRQGEVSGAELRRLEVERLRFSDDALQAELAARNARTALLALVGAPRLDQPLEPTDALAPPATAGATQAVKPVGGAAAGPARPDIEAARQDRARAEAELALQRALRTPNVSVAAGIKRDFGTNGLVLGVTVPLPLLDRNAAGIARGEAERRLADSILREREVAAAQEVQVAMDLVDVSRERVASIERDYLRKAREARDAVLAAYRAGEGGLLDYLDAQRAHREVQRAYNRALFDHRMSLFQLDAAVGARSGGLLP